MCCRVRLSFLVIGVLLATQGAASDHFDGEVTTSHRAGDLTDLYAFPTPGRPGFLTIILNAYPLVPSDGHFSGQVSYTIFVRRATLPGIPGTPGTPGTPVTRQPQGRGPFETGEETAIRCAVEAGATAEQRIACRGSGGLGEQGLRTYAGMRSDPFFLNTDFFSHASQGKLDPPADDNVMRGANVLAIVVEIDLGTLTESPSGLVAIAAESTGRAPDGALRRLDRVGRPELTNVSLAPRDGPDLRDQYNLDRSFEVPSTMREVYRKKLAENVAFYDALDGKTDWRDEDRQALAALVVDDFLIVDLDKPCPPPSFLEIEKSILRRTAHETCGGRRPEDDIVDTLYSLLIAGLAGSGGSPVRDGVDRPAAELSPSFPYLATPDLSLWSRLRVFVGRKILGISDLD